MRHKSVFAMSTMLVSAALVPTVALAKNNRPLPNCNAASLGAAVQAIVPNILPGSISAGLPTNGSTGSCLARPQAPAPGPTPFVTLAPINAVNAGVNVIGPCSAAQDSAGQQTPVGPTPEYCQVAFTYYPGGSGPNNPGPGLDGPGVPSGQPAYNEGEQQAIEIQISLPLNSADGGSGGIEGNWTGGILTGGSPGSSGSLSWAAFTDGIDMGGPAYAIRQGFVASETDTGQTAAAAANAGATNFAIIPSGVYANKIAYGTVADWIYRGTHYGKQWADAIAEIYYGEDPSLHYYNGCSGGGNQGMGQLQIYGDEYDGILIGAPAYRWQQFRLADSWPNLVMRKLVQLDGSGSLLTSAQASNLNAAILAACDVEGTDTVQDGLHRRSPCLYVEVQRPKPGLRRAGSAGGAGVSHHRRSSRGGGPGLGRTAQQSRHAALVSVRHQHPARRRRLHRLQSQQCGAYGKHGASRAVEPCQQQVGR